MDDKQKKYSILDELKNSSGYDIALMTTFNFEVGFFERAVLNRLYARDIRKISIFVDSKQLNEALKDVSTSFIGRKYMVNPVEMQGSFHPKVILLLGKDRAKLVVGSANIKTSGYSINNEIFNFIEYSSKNPGYLDVINAAIDFFIRINQESYQLDNKILEEAKKQIYYHPTKSNGECFLLDNISKSIFSQVTDIIKEPIDEVKIAVPYYDRELAALKSIKETYSTADIQLYIQNKTSSFPVDLNKKEHITKRIEVFSGFSDGKQPSVDNFYHGKVFLFKGKNRDYILYGSANCTNSALTKSYKDGGNIECNLLEIGANSDFDYFFDSINIIQVDELKSRPMTFESEPDSNYFYKYGKINKGAELHIGYYKKPDKLSIRIGDLEFDYEYVKKELVVYILEEYEPLVYDIFDICMISGNSTEKVHCWCFNNTELDDYRSKSSDKGLLDDFDINSYGDKYMEDRINLLNAEAAGLPEILEYKKNRAAFLQIQREQDDDTEFSDNDVRGKMILPLHGKEFFTSYGKHFFTWFGNQFFTSHGKQNFTCHGKHFFHCAVSSFLHSCM